MNELLRFSNTELKECKTQLQKNVKHQHEIRAFYQSQLKLMTKQQEIHEKEMKEVISRLEQENRYPTFKYLTFNNIRQLHKANSKLMSEKKCVIEKVIEVLSQMSDIRGSLSMIRKEAVTMSTGIIQEIAKTEQAILSKAGQSLFRPDYASVLLHQIEFIQEKYQNEMALRKKLQNDLIEEKGNIRVFCRVRPFISFDQSFDTNLTIIDENNISVLLKSQTDSGSLSARTSKIRQFELDRVYPMTAKQSDVFDDVRPLISSVLDGYNVCILAYGQTGSGKTYTMEGTIEDPGVIQRAIGELFNQMNDKNQTHLFKLSMTMVEIYNNEIRDLLDGVKLDSQQPKRRGSKKLEIQDIGECGLEIRGATTVNVYDVEQVCTYITRGSRNRSEASTLMNNRSSRSHSIVTIEVETTQTEHSRTILGFSLAGTRSKLRLVDLAGSECVGMSGVTGEHTKEASFVNRSLAALGDVMAALSQQNRMHVPYRNSRLTHLLQDSLGGNAKMLVLVCVSPTTKCTTETAHALSFGNRVRFVTRGATKKQLIV